MRHFLAIAAAVLLVPSAATAETARFALQSDLDHVWTITAAGLVFMMQAGFLLLEAGQVRSKNSINVAQKNLIDFVLSTLAFGSIGFALMFGASHGGWFGFSTDLALFNAQGDWSLTFFVFQLVFCGTAATIVSGAVAERASMSGYMLCTLMIACLIYPVAGHWAWGGLLSGSEEPWLARLGFMDFAGSTVVHSVGGWVSLAAIMIIGPRIGKFDENGKSITLHGHSPILSTFGALILWVGWIGFNGGSTTAGTGAFSGIIANTMVAGAAGGAAGLLIGHFRTGIHRPEYLINGSLAGLVGITAGCDAVDQQSALIIGASAGAVAYAARSAIEVIARLDDPLGAVAVHGVAGAWGTIMVGVFARPDALMAASRLEQVAIQALGVVVFFAWSFGLAYAGLRLAAHLLPSPDGPGRGLRVPQADEETGLNIAEHDAPLGISGLVRAMASIVENPAADIGAIATEPGEDSHEAAVLFNRIAENIRSKSEQERHLAAQSETLLELLSTTLAAVRDGRLDVRMPTDHDGPFGAVPASINDMISAIDLIVTEVAQSSTSVAGHAERLLSQSTELSTGSGDQADKLSALAQEMVGLRAEVDDNSARLEEALSNSEVAQASAAKALAISQGAVSSMQESARAIEQVEKTAEMIDEVAFATRLLSLNASVEAARASGADTQGFAVVAQEVRSLADKTSDAAGEIRAMIEGVRQTVADTVTHVTGTDSALDEVGRRIGANAVLMGEIEAMAQRSRAAIAAVESTLTALAGFSLETVSQAGRTRDVASDLQRDAATATAAVRRFTGRETPPPANAA